MAKISARGDTALATFITPLGARIVLTRQGRVLRKHARTTPYNMVHRFKSADDGTAAQLLQRTDWIKQHWPGARLR